MAKRKTGPTSAATIVRNLLRRPPATEGELELRLQDAPVEELRGLLVAEVEKPEVKLSVEPMLFAAIEHVGVGPEWGRMEAIVLDEARPRTLRSRAFRALTEEDPARATNLLEKLPPADVFLPIESVLEDMLVQLANEPEAGDELTEFLATMPGNGLPVLIDAVESIRARLQLPAAAIYADALRSEKLGPYRRLMLDAVIREGGEPGRQLITRLRDQATSDAERREFQGALLRIQTAAIEPSKRPERKGYAYVAGCDGAGAVMVLEAIESGKKSIMFGNLMVRVTGEVRDGFVTGPTTEKEMQSILKGIPSGIELRKFSLEEAAALVAFALSHQTKTDRKLPKEASVALTMIQQSAPAPLPDVTPAKGISRDQVDALLDGELFDSWLLDASDVPDVDEGRLTATPAWRKRVKKQLREGPAGARLIAMTRYMSYWYAFSHEPDSASLMAGLAAQLESDFDRCPLVDALIDRIVAWEPDDEVDEGATTFADPEHRQQLRREFFHNLTTATGQDLARLDYMEAATSTLNELIHDVPLDARPNPNELARIGAKIGRVYADNVSGTMELPGRDRFMAQLDLKSEGLEPPRLKAMEEIVPDVVASLVGFSQQVCERCPVFCLDKPKADLTKEFFSEKHPVDQKPVKRGR